jgi:hypothetical protein
VSAKAFFRFHRFAPGLLALLLTVGCFSARKEVAKKLPSVQAHWQADVKRQAALPDRVIGWPQALALLETNNLKIRAARFDVTNAQELAAQVFRDLIPTVNLRSGFSQSLRNLPATTFQDVTFNVDSFFNIPGVVNFNARLFSARLAVLRARAAYRLALREQAIELYKLFLEALQQNQSAAELKSERSLAEAVRQADDLSGQIMLRNIESEQLSQKKSSESLQTSVGELLADTQYHWILSTNGLPAFQYESHPLPLNDTNRVARLQMELVAIALVGAWAQIHGIKLQYWPELLIFVSGPSVYQLANGQSQFWSSADVTASADFFWTLDTRGYVGLQLRQTRREQELELAQLRIDSQELIGRLIAAQRLIGTLRKQIDQLDRVIATLDQVPQNVDLDSMVQEMDSKRSLRFQQFKLSHELAELNTLFWFVDEQKWAE